MVFLMVRVYFFIQIHRNILEVSKMGKEMAKGYILIQTVVYGKANGKIVSVLLVME